MLEVACILAVGFGAGYGLREWISRRRRSRLRREREMRAF